MTCLVVSICFSVENEDIILVQISFDGNNIENPPNLMTDDTFEGIKIRLKQNFASYLNIVYTGKHNFEICNINRNAANKLKSLSRKEKSNILQMIIVFCIVVLQRLIFGGLL